jgi:hypothetical protein
MVGGNRGEQAMKQSKPLYCHKFHRTPKVRHGRTAPARRQIKLSSQMETQNHTAAPVALDRLVRPFDAAAQMLSDLMAERGFRVARGTYHHGNGETLPTWVIDRPDSPAWNGVWMPWESAPENPEDSEAQTLLLLCGMAIEKWDKEAYVFIEPNA